MRMKRSNRQPLFLLLAVATMLSACSPAGQSGDSDNVMRIAVSAAAHPVNAALQSCALMGLSEDQQLFVESRVVDAAELGTFDFAVQLGEWTEDAQVIAEISKENLIVILHTSNPVRSLSNEQIADLFSGRIDNWNLVEGSEAEVALWISPESDEGRRALERVLLAGIPVSGNARLAASPQHMLDAVGADENALGLLPGAWVDSSVRSVESNIALPVLAVAGRELSGEASAIIACMQGEQGQTILAESYSR